MNRMMINIFPTHCCFCNSELLTFSFGKHKSLLCSGCMKYHVMFDLNAIIEDFVSDIYSVANIYNYNSNELESSILKYINIESAIIAGLFVDEQKYVEDNLFSFQKESLCFTYERLFNKSNFYINPLTNIRNIISLT